MLSREYPKWIHHRDLGSKIVQNAAEHEAQGPEWVTSIHSVHEPFAAGFVKPVVETKPSDSITLRAPSEEDDEDEKSDYPEVGGNDADSPIAETQLAAARKRGRPRKQV